MKLEKIATSFSEWLDRAVRIGGGVGEDAADRRMKQIYGANLERYRHDGSFERDRIAYGEPEAMLILTPFLAIRGIYRLLKKKAK